MHLNKFPAIHIRYFQFLVHIRLLLEEEKDKKRLPSEELLSLGLRSFIFLLFSLSNYNTARAKFCDEKKDNLYRLS